MIYEYEIWYDMHISYIISSYYLFLFFQMFDDLFVRYLRTNVELRVNDWLLLVITIFNFFNPFSTLILLTARHPLNVSAEPVIAWRSGNWMEGPKASSMTTIETRNEGRMILRNSLTACFRTSSDCILDANCLFFSITSDVTPIINSEVHWKVGEWVSNDF